MNTKNWGRVMREIRFRVWDKTTRNMMGDWHLLSPRMAMFIVEYANFPKDYVVMQYTGLNDKNGKEIYEGDIVQFFDCDGVLLDTFAVEWHESGGYFAPDSYGGDYCVSLGDYDTDEHTLNVIGNIYANPSLLKAKSAWVTEPADGLIFKEILQ